MRFLARRSNRSFSGQVVSDIRKRVEGVRIKHQVEENSIKMYDKEGEGQGMVGCATEKDLRGYWAC